MKTFEINLDIEKELYSPSNILFNISNIDLDSIELQFIIHQDESRMDLTGTTIELAIQKPSGLTVYQDCEITSAVEGLASTKLSIQSYVEYGIHTAEVYVRNLDQLAATTPFYYMSREAIMGNETIESTNDWSALQQALFAYDKKPILVDGVPTIIPEYVGQMAFDEIGKRAFIAYEISETGWQLLAAGEGGGGGITYWADIIGKPSTFTPSVHTHIIGDITGLQAALDAASAPAAPVDWVDVQNKPTTFAPENHMHNIAAITGLQVALDAKADDSDLTPFITETEADAKYSLKGESGGGGAWGEITGTLVNQTDLQNALNAKADDSDLTTKADVNHTHTFASITAKPATYPPDVHTHAFADITGKPATYPPDAHNHTIANVTGLQTALDGKADDADLTAKANTVDVYPKTETYTKTEVDAIANGITQGGGTIVQDNLTSTSTTAALSANQGRILNESKSDISHTHAFADITGKPATYPASAHTHLWADITDKPTTFAPENHVHTIGDITNLSTVLDGKADDSDLAGKADINHTHAFADITGKPATYPPEAHTHLWAQITDKPTTFTPSAHNHVIAEVTGLQTALDGKADDADLVGKANTVHTHLWADITDKPTTFAPTAHNHVIAEVTGLQADLDAKADYGDLAGLQADIDSKQDEPIQTTAAPVSTPTHIGQMAIDTTNKRTYVAEGATAGDWKRLAGTNYVDAGDNAIIALLGGLSLWKGTQTEYDAIGTKDPNKLYFIVG